MKTTLASARKLADLSPVARAQVDWWIGKLGADTPLDDIQPRDVRRHLQAETHLSGSTKNRYASALSAVFRAAQEEMVWDGVNPTRLIVKWPEGAPRQRALSRVEIEQLLVACRASTWPKLYLLVLLAITTGMRRGNLENLRHCDFNGNRIGPVLTKNGSQFIGVLTPEAAAELARFLEPGSTQLMFEGQPGKPFLFNNALDKAFKAAGLTDVIFHTFRHTAASMAATGGASTLQIMDLLNHKTPAMAARYSHLNVTAREKLVDAVFAGVR